MITSIIVASIASAITITLYYACNRISNKYAKGIAQLATVFLGIFISGALSSDTASAALAGQYFFFIVVVFTVIAKIFGKKRTDNTKA